MNRTSFGKAKERMANLEELTFDGYIFATPADAELAKNEIRRIEYLESHTDMSNLSVMKSVYDKALSDRYFQTPIGLEYMRELQKALDAGGYSEADIKPIPLYTTFRRIDLKESENVKRRVTKAEKRELSLRTKYRNAVLIATIFAFICFAMFIITMNGTTANAINYKNAVTNEYSAWEQELTQRENAVREKERELNMVP